MLRFDYYSITNATKKAAGALLAVGLFLLGLGILVILLKAVFVVIAAVLIFLAALWCIGTAIKMFAQISKYGEKDPFERSERAYRKNVRVHHRDTSAYNDF